MPMSFTTEYKNFDAVQLAELIKNKQVSPLEVLESCIELIDLYNPKINAVHHKLTTLRRIICRNFLMVFFLVFLF